MKKRCLLFILALVMLLAYSVSAVDVTLISPDDAYESSTNSVSFSCSASANESRTIAFLYFWTDAYGTWEKKYTSNFSPALFPLIDLPNGTFSWSCQAEDNSSNTAFGEIRTFTVNTTVETVTFTGPIDNQTWSEDSTKSDAFDLDTYFSTGPYLVTGNSLVTITIDSNNVVSFSGPANWSGIENVIFTSGSTESNLVTLTINGVNDAALYSTISNITINKNQNYTLNLSEYFWDIEGDELSYSSSSSPNLTIYLNSTQATIIPDENWEGLASIIFKAHDGNISTSANNISVIVGSVLTNNAPSIDSYSPISSSIEITDQETQAFSVTAFDNDNDTLSYSWYIDSVKESSASSSSYTYTDKEVGIHTILVAVFDSTTTTNKSWTLTISGEESAVGFFDVEEQDLESIIDMTASEGFCGDGVTADDETCSNCPNDVKCVEGQVCKNSECVDKASFSTGLIIFLIVLAVLGAVGAGLYFLSMRKSIYENRQKDKIIQQEEIKSLSELGERPPSEINDFYKPSSQPKVVPTKLNPLQKFIKNQKSRHITTAQIKKKLAAKGWTDEQISEAFEILK
ncbi:MAG: Ig-like domain-containing protein [archaeon]